MLYTSPGWTLGQHSGSSLPFFGCPAMLHLGTTETAGNGSSCFERTLPFNSNQKLGQNVGSELTKISPGHGGASKSQTEPGRTKADFSSKHCWLISLGTEREWDNSRMDETSVLCELKEENLRELFQAIYSTETWLSKEDILMLTSSLLKYKLSCFQILKVSLYYWNAF